SIFSRTIFPPASIGSWAASGANADLRPSWDSASARSSRPLRHRPRRACTARRAWCSWRRSPWQTVALRTECALLCGVRFQTILFDFDGTLVDSIELILESYRHTMRVHRGEPMSDALWLEGLGKPLR